MAPLYSVWMLRDGRYRRVSWGELLGEAFRIRRELRASISNKLRILPDGVMPN